MQLSLLMTALGFGLVAGSFVTLLFRDASGALSVVTQRRLVLAMLAFGGVGALDLYRTIASNTGNATWIVSAGFILVVGVAVAVSRRHEATPSGAPPILKRLGVTSLVVGAALVVSGYVSVWLQQQP